MSPAVGLSSSDDTAHDDDHEQLPEAPDEGAQDQLLPLPFPRNKRPCSLESSIDPLLLSHHKKSKAELLKVTLRPGLNLTDIPKISDFNNPKVQTLLLKAVREYEIMICTKGAFPSLPLRAQWGESCWENAQIDAFRGDSDSEALGFRYEFTDCMLRLMMRHGSHICGNLLNPVQAQVMSCYRLCDSGKASHMRKNAKIVSSVLLENTFHYKDPKTKAGYCENLIITSILCATWFKDLKSPGIIYKDYFDPISVDTLSLIFMLIRFCLEEWSTGKHLQAKFKETDLIKLYQTFCGDIDRWQKLNVMVTTNKCKKMFMHASRNAGMVDVAAPKPQLVGDAEECAQKELEGHTGETNSEVDNAAADTGDESE